MSGDEETFKRCEECGSWEAECSSDKPVPDCTCVRCGRVAKTKLLAEVARLYVEVERQAKVIAAWRKHGAALQQRIRAEVRHQGIDRALDDQHETASALRAKGESA